MNYYGSKELAESWRTVRKNTIQAAEDIPEDKYSFRAAPDTMTVAEMLAHLACSPHWAMQCHMVQKKTSVTTEDFVVWMGEIAKQAAALNSKAAIVAALKANGETFANRVEALTEEEMGQLVTVPMGRRSRFEALLGVKEHEMHHRAQLFLIERIIGIVPHLTRARQAAMAARS